MKKATIAVSYDSEKLNAIRLYLKQKDQTLEGEMVKAVDSLYNRIVPQGVRDFFEMQAASQSIRPVVKSKKPPATESEVPVEVTSNG